jgi:hypothetical protein
MPAATVLPGACHSSTFASYGRARAKQFKQLRHLVLSPPSTMQGCVQSLDYTLLKAEVMPRVYAACMRTTAAAVRIQVSLKQGVGLGLAQGTGSHV